MKLYSLGRRSTAPCMVLQFKETTVMLDCSLDMSTLQHFTPLSLVNDENTSHLKLWTTRELHPKKKSKLQIGKKINIMDEMRFPFFFSFVFFFNNSQHSGFKGKIYATEPTIQMGRELMLEMVVYAERVPRISKGEMWREREVLRCLPSPLCDLKGAKSWRPLYRIIVLCVVNIPPQFLNRRDPPAGFWTMIKQSFRSWAHENSNNLTFAKMLCRQLTGFENILHIQATYSVQIPSTKQVSYVSCSSTFTTHPLPMDQSLLKSSDALILTGVTEAPTANPDAMLGDFCNNLATTLKNGGNVLVPCWPSGVLYDLFECLYSYMDNASLTSIPIYFISPVADSSLAYSNIFAEWLCQSKQSKVYLPEAPFPHAELVKSGRLKHFPSIHDGLNSCFKTPCVVFAGHPSLRFGDVVHFIELWGKSSGNTIIFTEPEFPYLEALAPFQPLAMKACYCPIDPRLNFTQANKLIRELQPGHLAIPEAYTRAPDLLPHRTDLIIQDTECKISTFSFLEALSLPVSRQFEKVVLSNELANNLHPQEVRPGIAVATVTGTLVSKDNRYTLEPLELSEIDVEKPQ
ncbi:PREDICTED: integrator complex subunit 9 homolog [Acropora digitifera]|uniref:integrator complex subunit 9 homolog n=1 Tax=Acropora digitifera TaxID=70779 RepID=UPI00077AC2E6|nr:PREDICTED: integrator complex subunit 9 homolog [Acropora digitifera]